MPFSEYRHKIVIPEDERLEVRYYVSRDYTEHHARNFPPHVHDFVELYVLLEGDVSFMVEQRIFQLQAGDVVVSKPNELHHCILNSTSRHRHACFWIDADSELLAAPFLTHGKGEGNLIRPTEQDAGEIVRLVEWLDAHEKSADRLSRLRLILDLLCCVRQNIKAGSVASDTPPALLRDILSDIAANFREIRDLDYFTDKYFISRSTLGRLFRQHLHTTPRLYLETKRLAYSRELLREGKSVTEACMEAGFCDCSHFIRLFRARFEVTPLQYKNS